MSRKWRALKLKSWRKLKLNQYAETEIVWQSFVLVGNQLESFAARKTHFTAAKLFGCCIKTRAQIPSNPSKSFKQITPHRSHQRRRGAGAVAGTARLKLRSGTINVSCIWLWSNQGSTGQNFIKEQLKTRRQKTDSSNSLCYRESPAKTARLSYWERGSGAERETERGTASQSAWQSVNCSCSCVAALLESFNYTFAVPRAIGNWGDWEWRLVAGGLPAAPGPTTNIFGMAARQNFTPVWPWLLLASAAVATVWLFVFAWRKRFITPKAGIGRRDARVQLQ